MNVTLGEELKNVRLRKNLTLDDVAQQTRIPQSTLAKLEENDYSGFDSFVYAKSFLNLYGQYLGLDLSECLKQMKPASNLNKGGCEIQFLAGPRVLAEDPSVVLTEDHGAPRGVPVLLAPILAVLVVFLGISLFLAFQDSFGDRPLASGEGFLEDADMATADDAEFVSSNTGNQVASATQDADGEDSPEIGERSVATLAP